MIKKIVSFAALMLLSVASVNASVMVNFLEGAPKDSFVITNTGQCSLQAVRVDIDLTNTTGGLIFDTTANGAGVEVFQPFEVTKGDIQLKDKASVNDGDKILSVIISSIQPNASVSFTIDVDDTMRKSERGMIIVSGAEIENGLVTVTQGSVASSGTFGRNSKAMVNMASCS
ncbi:hypothetical protein SAMN05421760_101839 [Neptunomonas antarctica]|uniref:Aggregation factor core n=2 Tax=Neptunomonas antarctica TaxID=619304 RepID=A0A1N7JA24_9GAMM|nr:hypothetical protein SAMN05421760_101839 [Neptunomonas antarctica]